MRPAGKQDFDMLKYFSILMDFKFLGQVGPLNPMGFEGGWGRGFVVNTRVLNSDVAPTAY